MVQLYVLGCMLIYYRPWSELEGTGIGDENIYALRRREILA